MLSFTFIYICGFISKIQLSFPSYALMAPNECDLNFIEIFGEMTDLRHRLRLFCGSKIDIVLSKSNVLHLRLFAHHTALRSTFDALFTAVTLYRETEGPFFLFLIPVELRKLKAFFLQELPNASPPSSIAKTPFVSTVRCAATAGSTASSVTTRIIARYLLKTAVRIYLYSRD